MIPKQGLLLKFDQKFKQIAHNLETASPKVVFTSGSTTPVAVTDEVQSDLSPSPVRDKPSQKPLKKEIIKEQSKIYSRFKGDAKLTGWQEAVNAAALKIALKSPNKMYDRASLKTSAEAEARKTFVYRKKTGSRSKFAESETSVPKRKKQSTDDRSKEINLLSVELQSLTAQSANKQKEVAHANDLKEYERCASLHKELRAMLVERQQVQNKLSDLQKKEAKHLTYMARKTTSSRARATATATSTVSAAKVDIRSFLRVKTASDPNQDDCKESAEVVSKKRRLDFEEISGKSIVVGVEVADDEKIGAKVVEINGVKEAPCVMLEDKPVSDKKIDDEKSEVSGVKVASCTMVDDEVADNKKTSEEKDDVSGVKVVTCANVGDEVVDNKKTSQESGIKMVSSIASSEGVDNYFL